MRGRRSPVRWRASRTRLGASSAAANRFPVRNPAFTSIDHAHRMGVEDGGFWQRSLDRLGRHIARYGWCDPVTGTPIIDPTEVWTDDPAEPDWIDV